ncbi:hypothetical protein ACSBR1_023063 [Camellia fascicularis]
MVSFRTFTITANASLYCESDSHPKMVFSNKSSDCCSWKEVTCDWSNVTFRAPSNPTTPSSTSVTSKPVILPSMTSISLEFHLILARRIPSKISHLSKLISLDLSYNELGRLKQHTFNMFLRNLTQLRELYLDWLKISSPLPYALLNLPCLTSLSLADCQLHGKFNLKALNSLYLFNCNLSGSIPASLWNLTQITNLGFGYNSFGGQIPSSISNLAKLNGLYLFGNNWNGQIPDSLGNMSQLTSLYLHDNSLNGTTPSSLFELQYLTKLQLSSNNLSGVVELHKLLSLKYLSRLDPLYNGLSLNINNSFQNGYSIGGKDSLYNLNLSHNFLTSLEHLPWKNLEYIDLHSNLLQGSLPVPPNTTIVFSISNNKLTGEIPPLICGLRSLVVLDLFNNSLSGLIPQCLGNLSNRLLVLNLGINSFHGTFIATFTKGNMLRNLNLMKTKLKDKFCDLCSVVLLLRFNRFHGHIGTFKTKGKHPFPKLRIIDISYNEFTGLFSTNYIKQFEAMMNVDERELKLKYMGEYYYQDSVVVMMKGYEIEYSRILTIPKSIEKLNSLRGLNLSYNNLTGHIPTSLGNLTNLESLDLSSNELVGEIPQHLASLMFLEVLNLSNNQLVGRIPQGRQFNTFENDSYNGNLALCGFPLSKICEEQQPLPLSPTLQHDENSDWEGGFNWKVVVMGYGCGFVFGMVMGYLMFVTRSPECLMKIVEGKQYKKVKRSMKSAH